MPQTLLRLLPPANAPLRGGRGTKMCRELFSLPKGSAAAFFKRRCQTFLDCLSTSRSWLPLASRVQTRNTGAAPAGAEKQCGSSSVSTRKCLFFFFQHILQCVSSPLCSPAIKAKRDLLLRRSILLSFAFAETARTERVDVSSTRTHLKKKTKYRT